MKTIILLVTGLMLCSCAFPWVWVEQGVFKNDQEIRAIVKILLPIIRENSEITPAITKMLALKKILVLIDGDNNIIFLPSSRCQTTKHIKELPPVMKLKGSLDQARLMLRIFAMQTVPNFSVTIVWDEEMGKRVKALFDGEQDSFQEETSTGWSYCSVQ